MDDDRRERETFVRETVQQQLIESGEKERLKDLLRQRLVECGWRDELKAHCKELIKQKGVEHITVEGLVEEIIPKGRANVPDRVKAEILQKIRQFLSQS